MSDVYIGRMLMMSLRCGLVGQYTNAHRLSIVAEEVDSCFHTVGLAHVRIGVKLQK